MITDDGVYEKSEYFDYYNSKYTDFQIKQHNHWERNLLSKWIGSFYKGTLVFFFFFTVDMLLQSFVWIELDYKPCYIVWEWVIQGVCGIFTVLFSFSCANVFDRLENKIHI